MKHEICQYAQDHKGISHDRIGEVFGMKPPMKGPISRSTIQGIWARRKNGLL